MIYRTLVFTNTSRHYNLHEDDIVKRVDGGFEVTWHSSPSTTTFYPFHRISEYTEVDTSKIPEYQNHQVDSETLDDSML